MDTSGGNGGAAKAFGGLAVAGALATFAWMLWQAQSSRTETLERLTNQRMKLIETGIKNMQEHMSVPSHSVAKEWHSRVTHDVALLVGRIDQDDVREKGDAAQLARYQEA